MTKKYKTSLFIFRRDLRLEDNTALLQAVCHSEKVLPIFIFDDRQIKNNPYRADNLIQFMLESLSDLNTQLNKYGTRLYCFEGIAEKIISQLLSNNAIQAIYFNKDYTPFALKRDSSITEIARQLSCSVYSFDDALLNPPGSILKSDGKPYTVFTPFFKTACKIPVHLPQLIIDPNFFTDSLIAAKSIEQINILKIKNPNIYISGGRNSALKLMKNITQLANYKDVRDLPAVSGTTKLSAHNKFGTISVRELYQYVAKLFGSSHTIIQELYWRDFFTHIAFHFSHVFEGCFHRKYDQIRWEDDSTKFDAWCHGTTGFPLVDAGMRELNSTGFMHNRVRMVTASFLVKDLHINWRKGEQYFAQKLIDYDPAVNNGNWQWAASTGCDAQPYFRVFNPWRQLERFDPECDYVKKWLPELASLTAKQIMQLEKQPQSIIYPAPIVDHREAKELAEELFRNVAR